MIQAKRKGVKEAKSDRDWLRYLALCLGLYLIWTLTKGVVELRTAYARIEESRRILEVETIKGEQLKRKWAQVQTLEYLEEVARNDLNMQKDGETIVVVPKTSSFAKASEGQAENQGEAVVEANWQKWWNLVK